MGGRSRCESSLEMRYLRNWICYILDEEVPISAVPEKFRSGIFPLQVLEKLGVRVNTQKTFEIVTNKNQCLQNLRVFLNLLAKQGANIYDYKEKDLYLGRTKQVWGIIQLIFTDIFYPQCLETSETIYKWLSESTNSLISSENLIKALSVPSIFLSLIKKTHKKADLNDFPNQSIREHLTKNKLPCFFEESDFINNTNFSFLYIQLWAIFLNLQENSLFCRSSTDSTSKDSMFELNSSLDIFINSPDDLSKQEKVNSIKKSLKNNDSRLNEIDLVLCFLTTPRIVQIVNSDQLIRVLLSFVEESQGSNKLFINVTELDKLETAYYFSLDQIDYLESSDISLTFHILKNQKLKVVFKNQSECSQYLNGIYSIYK